MIPHLISKLSLTYTDPLQEKEYLELKIPLNKEFFKYLSFGLAFLYLPLTIRFYIKDWFPQTYIGMAFIAFGVLVFLFKNKLLKFMQFISLVFISAAITMAIYNAHIGVPVTNPLEAFYMGYTFALMMRMIDFRVTKFYLALVFNFVFLVACFIFIRAKNVEQMVLIVTLEILPAILNYQAEKADRLLFNSLYQSKTLLLKFEQLLTEYLPNPIAVLTSDYSKMRFNNDAFKKLFRSENDDDIKSALDNLVLDDQDCEENKLLLQELDYTCPDVEDFTALKFSKLMEMLTNKREICRDSDVISLQLIEQATKMEESCPQDFKRRKQKRTTTLIPSSDQTNIPMFAFSKQLPKSEDISLIDRSPLVMTRKDLDIQNIPLVACKNISEEQNDFVGDPTEHKLPHTDTHDFKRRVFKVKMFPLTWDNQEAIALVLDDVTHERTIMELKISDKNKDLVIATVSHELRTPLNGMLGLLEIMKKEIRQPEIMVYMNACKANSRLLLNLVNSILDLSQIKNNKLRLIYSKVVINELLAEAKSLFDHFCQVKNLFLEIEVDQNVPRVIITDPTRLSQIIINLLGNAFKFTFKGGVTLKVDLEQDDPNKIKFSIIDTGIGIKKEDQEKLFKLFGRLEQQDKKINTQGVGLGLTISNNLAVLLNSVNKTGIQVESELGIGTTFSFTVQSESRDKLDDRGIGGSDSEVTMCENINENVESQTVLERMTTYTELRDKQMLFSPLKFKSAFVIPRCDSKKALTYAGHERKGTDSQTPEMNSSDMKKLVGSINKKGSPWCLIVDDNPFNLMVAINIMKERGYQVKTALNGQEAISTVKEHNSNTGRIQIILMDCQMPVMDGYEASRILNEMMKAGEIEECPIVALTANNQDEEHEKLWNDAGMSGCIQKPLNVKDLEDMLKRMKKLRESGKKIL